MTALPRALAPLRHAHYRWLAASLSLSLQGDRGAHGLPLPPVRADQLERRGIEQAELALQVLGGEAGGIERERELPLPLHPRAECVEKREVESRGAGLRTIERPRDSAAPGDTPGAVMFPTLAFGTTRRALTADDIAGVKSLYP